MYPKLDNVAQLRLGKNKFPGQVLVIGKNDSNQAIIMYAVLSRAPAFGERHFHVKDKEIYLSFIRHNEDFLKRECEHQTTSSLKIDGKSCYAVGNGHQVSAITNGLKDGNYFPGLLNSEWTHKNDVHGTPRISGLITLKKDIAEFSMSQILQQETSPKDSEYHCHSHLKVSDGMGKCLLAYDGDDDPLSSFRYHPFDVPLVGDIKTIGDSYWSILYHKYRTALFVRSIDLSSRKVNQYLIRY